MVNNHSSIIKMYFDLGPSNVHYLIIVFVLTTIFKIAYTLYKYTLSVNTSNTSLHKHNVLITGSTKGIGFAMAKEFAKLKHNVVISSREDSRVQRCVTELTNEFPQSKIVGKACDVTSAESLDALATFAVDQLDHITLWINNAGVTQQPHVKLINTEPDEIRRVVDINLVGTLLGNRIAFKTMLAHPDPSGAMTHVFSMDGAGSNDMVTANFATYGASKAGMNQIRKTLCAEMKGTSVGVHMLSPGMVTTELLLKSSNGAELDASTKKVFNILAERPETVAPWLVKKVLDTRGSGKYHKYLTAKGVVWRFMTAFMRKNRLIPEEPGEGLKKSQ